MDWNSTPVKVLILQRNRRKNVIVEEFWNHEEYSARGIVELFRGKFPTNRFFYLFQV